MMTVKNKIIYTRTDEAPALATESFLPIVEAFTSTADIEIKLMDISLAARILANFPERLDQEQKVSDALSELGELAKKAEANIIKLPNISASIPQLKAAIKELQEHGYKVPNFPEEAKKSEDEAIRAKYGKVLGSAVNPILREGNSDRRVAGPVKQYAKDNPHSMGDWAKDSKTHVSHMKGGDFYGSEKSVTLEDALDLRIEFIDEKGVVQVLKEKMPLLKGEVIDGSLMSVAALRKYLHSEIVKAKDEDLLLSLHMKATMMKVSDPIIFGEAVKAYYGSVFEKYAKVLDELGVDAKNGVGDAYDKIENLPTGLKSEIKKALDECCLNGPRLAMVNSDKGITNLHVPSDVIIDASMPAAIRSSGKMWGADGSLHDTKALIPDRCYAGIYQEIISFCKENGAFDVETMGNVSNVGLMAKKAEEYGSHDKTFLIEKKGQVRVVDLSGNIFIEHEVEKGDVWRMCQTKDEAIKDWVKLGVARARATGHPAVFWLDENRGHDRCLIQKVNQYLKNDKNDKGDELDIRILSPIKAMGYTLKRVKKGDDTISITGNVLRDYLTDLFPILELGTSAKMLSIVPLLAGGGLFETGAGGSAPKHVEQFIKENHLRWDSLGEFLALSVSLEDLGEKNNNKKALLLSKALNQANGKLLKNKKTPSRKVGELDNRGSHFYLAMYWAEFLSEQNEDKSLQLKFLEVARKLKEDEGKIIEELASGHGKKINMKGYFDPEMAVIRSAMRPSHTFNEVISQI